MPINQKPKRVEYNKKPTLAGLFSPELLDLLEEHILLSPAAQETRDMIRILAQVFKSRGDVVPPHNLLPISL